MRLPTRRKKSRTDKVFDALGTAAKAGAAWQATRGAAKGTKGYAKVKGAKKAAKGTGGLLKRLPVLAGAGALVYALVKRSKSDDSGFASPSWESSAGTETGGAATAATGTPPVGDEPHAAGGVDVPPAVAASGGDVPAAPVAAAEPADPEGTETSGSENPSDGELEVEAPNESAPGHHPTESEKN